MTESAGRSQPTLHQVSAIDKGMGAMEQIKGIAREESGETSIEYALMAGLIAVAIAVTVRVIGNSLIPIFTNAAAGLGS